MTLQIKDLYVKTKEKEILHGVTCSIKKGETVALMGPNGSGKSTLAQTIMGNPKYEITKGSILLNKEDITKFTPDEKAKRGIFLSFQHPEEIEGVTVMNFLKTAYSTKFGKISVIDFYKILKEKMQELDMEENFAKRYLNVGFSGGEKKKLEILQLAILKPEYAILDETDSGTDVDALKVIAQGINKIKKDTGILIITHYTNILKYIKADRIIVMDKGKIVREDAPQLANEIEEKGFKITQKKEETDLIKALRTIEDPELHIDIITLGLIYELKEEKEKIKVEMTFTSPVCPFGPELVEQVKKVITKQRPKQKVEIKITFDPVWTPSEELKTILGIQ